MVVTALPRLRRSWVSESATRARGGEAARAHSCAARTSAMCMTRTPARWRLQRSADVHQAGRVHRGADLRTRVEHVAQLVGEHRHRRVGVLDREGAAEAAALQRLVHVHQVDPAHGAQQPLGPVADVQRPHRMARRVQRDPVRERGADVLHPEHVDEELAQLVHGRPRERHAEAAGIPRARSPRTTRSGTRRLRSGEHAPEPLGQRPRLARGSPSCRASGRSTSAPRGTRPRSRAAPAPPPSPARPRGTACR